MVWNVKDIDLDPIDSKKPKAAKKGKKKQPELSAEEEAWNRLSLGAPPPLPQTLDPSADGSKRKRTKPNIEDVHEFAWSEVQNPSSLLLTSDDAGGFVCLEELSDVDVEYEGTEATGQIIKFKKSKATKSEQKLGPANPEKPLSIEETKEYYDLDTFNENIANTQKADGLDVEGEGDQDTEMQDNIESDGQNEENVAPVSADVEEQSEQPEAKLSAKERKKKEKLEKAKEKRKAAKEAAKARKLIAQTEQAEAEQEDDGEEDEVKSNRPSVSEVDQDFDTSKWDQFKLHEDIVNGLKYHKFGTPTPIQEKTLPLATEGRDIIGAAETGSGKTLAFGIPIAQYIASLENEDDKHKLAALILTPTRELAIQVKNHIQNITCFMDIRTIAVVGGMSAQKQIRQLRQKPNIIVATPGRLWELFSETDEHLNSLKQIKFLVLDEADRMIEGGHFQEVDEILRVIQQDRKENKPQAEDEAETEPEVEVESNIPKLQTLVFTATLSNSLRFDVKKRKVGKKSKGKAIAGSMEDLVERLELKNKDPAIVDITTSTAVASKLVEAKIDCLNTEKDVFLYYFVTRYPGRTIVFVNSIDSIRRLVPVSKLLGMEVIGLHAQMQQKQRLKNLDKFKANDKAILVASDVAARGLDIPLVEHVIHYQIPRSGEIYVHRSGRTARANQDGVSLMLCSPEELSLYKKLVHRLRKGEPYPDFPVDYSIQREMKKRVELATKIDKQEHRLQKISHDDDWMKRMANDLDIEYDEDVHSTKRQKRKHSEDDDEEEKIRQKIRGWKGELKHMCAQPLLPHGASMKYITGSTMQDLVQRLLNEDRNEKLPGSAISKAVDDVKSKAKNKKKAQTA
ncbi:P-loop containing nucleoside triphosphate hydrolase protein [Umbelopsis sp. AD052]|nr:P-loop containing nucleoside triphosphate hydrolase protein [Umbelopsis sp. AD052]